MDTYTCSWTLYCHMYCKLYCIYICVYNMHYRLSKYECIFDMYSIYIIIRYIYTHLRAYTVFLSLSMHI